MKDDKMRKLRNPIVTKGGVADSELEAQIIMKKTDDEIRLKNPELFGGSIEDYPTLPAPKLQDGEVLITQIALAEKPIEVTIEVYEDDDKGFWDRAKTYNVKITLLKDGQLKLTGLVDDINRVLELEGDDIIQNREDYEST